MGTNQECQAEKGLTCLYLARMNGLAITAGFHMLLYVYEVIIKNTIIHVCITLGVKSCNDYIVHFVV